MCAPLCNFIEVLGIVHHGGEMIDISDGNSILHQHRVVNLLALLKKSLNNVLLMFCRASPF